MKAFQYRTDEEILEKLKKSAEENRRSINQEIDYIVRQYLIDIELKRDIKE